MTWVTQDLAEYAVSLSLDSYPDEAVELDKLHLRPIQGSAPCQDR